ncbi:phosphotransferase [Streptomyces abyssomicinicus]|uniref:phosphotransferase n=1 Tax=Streptomyces abyssomicinicus TaxID=574929 RepID=UPI00124FC2BC|nr:phosphotransferase [Streptomyces abyssomicinicus]
MSADERHTEPLDVHLIALRDGAAGPEVLLSRRAGDVYAAGCWHLPSGHLDGPHEDVVTALVREAREETGVTIDPADVRSAVTVHHRAPGGRARVGFFFEVRRWQGTPRVREPEVCDGMGWFPLGSLPGPMVAYCRAGLDAYRAGARMAVHFQEPGDPIAYAPDSDRLRPVPGPGGTPGDSLPPAPVRDFAERAVGRIAAWADASWHRENSRVWQARGTTGGTWYVKVHQNDRFHQREVTALRGWAVGLGDAAPRLVAADPVLRAVVLTAVRGRPLHAAGHPPERQRRIFRRVGQLAAAIHRHAPPHPAGRAVPTGKLDRHLAGARAHLAPGDEEFVRSTVERAADLPAVDTVCTHGDFQPRNLLWDEAADTLHVIDFERSEPGPAVRDLARLSDAWAGRPDLREAFLTGYGRTLTAPERERLIVDTVLDSVSGIAYGVAHGDPELVERGRRTLATLRAEPQRRDSPPGD